MNIIGTLSWDKNDPAGHMWKQEQYYLQMKQTWRINKKISAQANKTIGALSCFQPRKLPGLIGFDIPQ